MSVSLSIENLKDFSECLTRYKSRLKEISEKSDSYNIFIRIETKIFFEKLNKIDKNLIFKYIKELDKENISNNKNVERDALIELFSLTISEKKIEDFFNNIFPDRVEIELTPKSSWIIVLLFQIFISFFIKPKLNLRNYQEDKTLLDAVQKIKNIKDHEHKDKDKDNLVSTVLNGWLENYTVKPKGYTPIDKERLKDSLKTSITTEMQRVQFCSSLKSFYSNLTNISLFEYLSQNINAINAPKIYPNLKEKIDLLKELVDDKKLDTLELNKLNKLDKLDKLRKFAKEINDFEKIFQNEVSEKNLVYLPGIFSLIKGIIQCSSSIFNISGTSFAAQQNDSLREFRKHFYFSVHSMRHIFSGVMQNLNKQHDVLVFTGNRDKLFSGLDDLGAALYEQGNSFNLLIDQSSFDNLFSWLSNLISVLNPKILELEQCCEGNDSKLLQGDIIFLLEELRFKIAYLETLKAWLREQIGPDDDTDSFSSTDSYQSDEIGGTALSAADVHHYSTPVVSHDANRADDYFLLDEFRPIASVPSPLAAPTPLPFFTPAQSTRNDSQPGSSHDTSASPAFNAGVSI